MNRQLCRGLIAAAFLVTASAATASTSNPPDFYPGVQGMASCLHCHDSQASYGGPGSASIDGLPSAYTPGAVYTLTMRVKQPGAGNFGFALYAVDQDGQQAGALEAPDTRVDVKVARGVTFLKQSFHGTHQEGDATYTFQWRAPQDPSTRVGFVAEAVAGDAHGSVKGDNVYRVEAVVEAADPGRQVADASPADAEEAAAPAATD